VEKQDVQNRIVPIFDGVKNTAVIARMSIKQVLEKIKTEYTVKTKHLRGIIDKDKATEFKKTFKAAIFSADFEDSRKKENIKTYNSIMVLDIDKLDEHELTLVKTDLQSDPFVYSCWISPSGNGLKGIVPLKYEEPPYLYPDMIDDAHKAAFSVLKNYFLDSYNISMDPMCNDYPRLCFLSHDADLVINDNVQFFDITSTDITDYQSGLIHPRKTSTIKTISYTDSRGMVYQSRELEAKKRRNYKHNRMKMQQILKFLKNRGDSITYDYQHWLNVAFALSSTFPYVTAIKYFLELCRLDGSKHNELESQQKFAVCYKQNLDRFSFGTIRYYAGEYGYGKRR